MPRWHSRWLAAVNQSSHSNPLRSPTLLYLLSTRQSKDESPGDESHTHAKHLINWHSPTGWNGYRQIDSTPRGTFILTKAAAGDRSAARAIEAFAG